MRAGRILSAACTALLVAALFSQLTACGYRLGGHTEDRQQRPFSASLKRVSIEGVGRYDGFRKTLVATLRTYGIKVVAPGRASSRLIFSDKRESRRRVAVGDDVKAREYLLTVEVLFGVFSSGETFKPLLPEQSVRAEAAYLADPDRPLFDAGEKRVVMKDLDAELCRKIILRLQTIGG